MALSRERPVDASRGATEGLLAQPRPTPTPSPVSVMPPILSHLTVLAIPVTILPNE